MFDLLEKEGPDQVFSASASASSSTTRSGRISSMSIGELRSRLAEIKALEASLAAEKIQIVSRMEHMARDERPVFVVPEHELVAHAGLSCREARSVIARSVIVDEAPVFGDLLAAGATTAAHVDAMKVGLRLTGADHDAFLTHVPELAQAAQSMSIGEFSALVRTTVHDVTTDDDLSRFERQCRSTHLKIWDDADGMTQIRGSFDPVSGAAIRGAIERQLESMFHAGDPSPVVVAPWVASSHWATGGCRRMFERGQLVSRQHSAALLPQWNATECGFMQMSRSKRPRSNCALVAETWEFGSPTIAEGPPAVPSSTSRAGCCRRVEARHGSAKL